MAQGRDGVVNTRPRDGANFSHASIADTHLEGSELSRGDFRDAIDADKAHFEGACFGPGEREKPVGLSQEIMTKIAPCN